MPEELRQLGMSEKTWKWYHSFVARMIVKHADKIHLIQGDSIEQNELTSTKAS